jgi:hypothetical protein
LFQWATEQFGLSASHPAGKDETGKPRKNLWPPPEGSAALPPEDKNPLIKLLMDVSMSQETLLEDYVLLANRFNIHRCSDYCLGCLLTFLVAKSHSGPLPMQVSLLFLFPVKVQCQFPFYKLSLYQFLIFFRQ